MSEGYQVTVPSEINRILFVAQKHYVDFFKKLELEKYGLQILSYNSRRSGKTGIITVAFVDLDNSPGSIQQTSVKFNLTAGKESGNITGICMQPDGAPETEMKFKEIWGTTKVYVPACDDYADMVKCLSKDPESSVMYRWDPDMPSIKEYKKLVDEILGTIIFERARGQHEHSLAISNDDSYIEAIGKELEDPENDGPELEA